jgi:hypothetical protein
MVLQVGAIYKINDLALQTDCEIQRDGSRMVHKSGRLFSRMHPCKNVLPKLLLLLICIALTICKLNYAGTCAGTD